MPAGFNITDVLIVSVIKDKLKFLANNPSHLEFILGMFIEYPEIKEFVGAEHVKNCIDFVTKNEIHVAPFYEQDVKRRPSIVVVCSGHEQDQFIGDSSGQYIIESKNLPATVFAEWDVSGYDGTIMKVAKEYSLDKKLWHNVIIKNGDFESRLDGIRKEADADYVYLKDEIPVTVSLKGWKSTSSVPKGGLKIAASSDDVTAQIKLTTTGDYSTHRLLATVLRYCIKKARLDFDYYGLQISTFSYTAPMATEENEMEFETGFVLTGKAVDHWIESEFNVNDDASNIQVCGTAQSEGEGNQDAVVE